MTGFDPLIPDILSMIAKGMDLYRYIQNRSERAIARGQEESRGVAELYDFLRVLYYDVDMLTGPDGPFPIGTVQVPPAVAHDPEKLLGTWTMSKPPKVVDQPDVLAAIRSRGSTIWDGATFSLDSLEVDGDGQARAMDAFIGTYFDMVNSAVYLEYETLAAVARSSRQTPYGIEDLPKRRLALASHDRPVDCLLNGGGVDATIAISTLVVYLRDGEYWMLCEVRSSTVAEYGDLYHVAPSFIFQPVLPVTRDNLAVEWSVHHNIFREYLEELFNYPEVAHARRVIAPDYFYGHPNLQLLHRLLDAGLAELRAVAVAFNLLNHRPELCTVLTISDPSWYEMQKDVHVARRHGLELGLNFNDEFRPSEQQDPDVRFESVRTMRLHDPRWLDIVKPWSMVPPGAPALILGAKDACETLALDQPSWLSQYTIDPGSPVPQGL